MPKGPYVNIRKLESYSLPELELAVGDMLGRVNSPRMKRSKRVLIKPNALAAYPPERGVTTHPMVLEAIIKYFLENDKEVWLGDSPGGSTGFKQVFDTCGFSALADKYPIKLVNISSAGFREISIEGVSVKVSELLWQCGIFINVAKYKTHSLMAFTGAIKNLYGLVPGMIKTEYHKLYPDTGSFAAMLNILYRAVRKKISYNFIDGIQGMDGAGPSAGRVRDFGLFFGSESAPALDWAASSIMGFKLKDVPYLSQSLQDDGILPSRIRVPASFRNYRMQDADIKLAKLSKEILFYVPRPARAAFKRWYDVHPYVGPDCKKCEVCVKNCPVTAIDHDADGYPVIDQKRCIRCMCCHELCPHQAIKIHKPYLLKMIGH